MGKPPSKMDREKLKLRKKREFDFQQELHKMGADMGFVKYLLAKSFVLPFDPFVDFVLPSNPSETKKLHQSNWKKIYRRIKAQGGDHWKDRWEEMKRQLKDLKKRKYVQSLFGFEPAIIRPKLTKPSQDRILGTMWMLKTYFERLTKEKSKTGRGRPCWKLIAELLELIYPIPLSRTDVTSWWGKAKKDFKIINEENEEAFLDSEDFLDSHWEFYQRHKAELDNQCQKWLAKCVELILKNKKEETHKGFGEEIEKWREFSEE